MASEWYIATVRHGETDFNRQGRYAGSIDVGLNDRGREEVTLASKLLRQFQYDISISSSLKRAVETARILTEGRTEIIPCDYARERHYGVLQGLTLEEVERIRPPVRFIRVGGDYHSLDPPEGESFEELRARAEKLRDYILSNHRGRRVLIVSHGTFLQQFHGLLRGQDWIESLGTSVGNLLLTTFHWSDDKVIREERLHLTDKKQGSF